MSELDSPHVTGAPLVAILAYQQLGLFEFGCAAGLSAPQRPELEVDWYRSVVRLRTRRIEDARWLPVADARHARPA
ncbi:hypothetical protein LL967_19230 [Xanthomonas campestris pv. zinniae]|nr:hypothetical protein [Xanthomonas campestris pv. zinniae]